MNFEQSNPPVQNLKKGPPASTSVVKCRFDIFRSCSGASNWRVITELIVNVSPTHWQVLTQILL